MKKYEEKYENCHEIIIFSLSFHIKCRFICIVSFELFPCLLSNLFLWNLKVFNFFPWSPSWWSYNNNNNSKNNNVVLVVKFSILNGLFDPFRKKCISIQLSRFFFGQQQKKFLVKNMFVVWHPIKSIFFLSREEEEFPSNIA